MHTLQLAADGLPGAECKPHLQNSRDRVLAVTRDSCLASANLSDLTVCAPRSLDVLVLGAACHQCIHAQPHTVIHTHTDRQTDRQTAGCQSHPTRAPWLRSAKRSPHRPEHVEKDAAVISRPVLRYCVPSDLVQFVRGFADNESGASRWPTSATSVIVAATRRVLTRIT